MNPKELDRLCVTTLRMLAVDAVEQANSGHPGLPLGAAPMAYVLWSRILNHSPEDPRWVNRDRFILSAGHGSALLYALLHLHGYPLTLDEVKKFRQLHSLTPGHPEYGHTPGVEATTGPLGQGFAMGVGMAMAERRLANQFNKPGHTPVNHTTYAIVSDGDLMEGLSYEAASLAGHLKLGKLIYLYDDNRISIEGSTEVAFTENVEARFRALGWDVHRVADGEDLDAIETAIRAAQAVTDQPSLIMVRTIIGLGSPKQDTHEVHGSPIKGADMAALRQHFGWPETRFFIPDDAADHFRRALAQGRKQVSQWRDSLDAYWSAHPDEASLFESQLSGKLPPDWDTDLNKLNFDAQKLATRVASGKALNALAPRLPALMGGSADLAPSNNTHMSGVDDARNLHFGVREHAMAAISNGMALHGGILPFCATFLVFSDYMRGAIRLSALMNAHIIYVLTHDSVAVGEDGPTHQPVEHVASLRLIPNLLVFRPADASETAFSWRLAVELGRPTALILTRQNLPALAEAKADGVARGGYILSDGIGEPELILLATGSEVSLALKVQQSFSEHKIRVVSLPCWELFLEQPLAYRQQVLPPSVGKRIAIEAGATMGWERWVGEQGEVIGLDRFGISGPGDKAMETLGFSVEHLTARVRHMLEQ